jgi:hypothetical protein
VSDVLSLLKDLIPIWLILLLVGFGYLVVLIKSASDRFLELAEKQSDFLKDRLDVVDKSTGIFTRTIEQQEKEIAKLTEEVGRLGSDLQNTRETDARLSVQELKVLSSIVQRLSVGQQELFSRLGGRQSLPMVREPAVPPTRQLPDEIRDEIPKAIRARDLSIYSISLTPMKGSRELVTELRESGYAASLYGEESDRLEARPEDQAAIWVGAAVPPNIVVDVITIARRQWPYLRYVHLSSDGDSSAPEYIHTQIYLGGSTGSAITFLKCRPWDHDDFTRLSNAMTTEELHQYIRARYAETE